MSCGYQGHVCGTVSGKVQFISRYRGENDYCVGGRRVSVSDAGELLTADVTPAECRALALYLLNEYADYCQWRFTVPGLRDVCPLTAFERSELVRDLLKR